MPVYVACIMSHSDNKLRLPTLYWREMKRLKDAAVGIRLSRNHLGRRVRAVELVKAIASSGGIAGWVVWRAVPFLWAGIIVAAQVLDALEPVLRFAAQYRAASQLTVALELLFLDAEDEWERIRAGTMTTEAIGVSLSRLKKRHADAAHKLYPEWYEPSGALLARAAG
jgi:hypothetical protein